MERTTEKEISIFESELGSANANGLNQVVDHFEEQLINKYGTSNLKKAFEHHLNNIINSDGLTFGDWLPAQYKKDSIFNRYSIGLVEEIWMKPDSVWIEDSNLHWTYSNGNHVGYRTIHAQPINYDSLIYKELNTERFNWKGQYLSAIHEISESNEVAEWYYEIKFNAGTISPHITAQAFLNGRVELDDYLVKRIILVETFTTTCSNSTYK